MSTLHAGRRPLVEVENLDDAALLELLPVILQLSAAQRAHMHDCVRELRRRRVTWREICGTLGTTRQATWERFARPRSTPAGSFVRS